MRHGFPDPLRRLLKDVSRSFYLTLSCLPGAIRPQMGLAYLLARASDTIADTDAVPPEQRLAVLGKFLARLDKTETRPLVLDQLTGHQSSPAERALLGRLEDALGVVDEFSLEDQERIQTVLATIISGQMLDVRRFGGTDSSRVAALEDDAQLDDYIYRVAGCVGEFWTRMCRTHLFPRAPVDEQFLVANGIRFGKGLQLVNVLRDLPADLRIGRCYLPRKALAQVGLEPVDLFQTTNEPALRPVYQHYLEQAEAHLDAGWAYTNHLPVGAVRVRLACAWPILIGMQTLAKLRNSCVLDPSHRIRITRRQVRSLIARSVLWYPWPGRWRQLAAASKHSRQNTLPQAKSFVK